jgi:hypothetical protein
METIQKTIESDVSSFPSWITEHKSIPSGKIASSSNDMKMYLRHVAFPHVLSSYGKIIDEMCVSAAPTPDTVGDSATIKAESETESPIEGRLIDVAAPGSVSRVKEATLHLPMHTAPVCAKPDGSETAVEDFFRGLVAGRGGEACSVH